MNTPPLSVLLPVYNAERYVGDAVESILAQTFADFEFIIIDDGSTDGSLSILERHARCDSRIRLISRENTGYTRALNESLDLARGEFVARMDADDISLPERFARQLEYFSEHGECVALGSQVLLMDPDGDPINELNNRCDHEGIVRAFLHEEGGAITHPAAMMRLEAVIAIGGYREAFEPAEDMDLFLRLAEKGQLANLPEILLHYRMHPMSVGNSRWRQQGEMVDAIRTEASVRFGLANSTKPAARKPPLPLGEQHRTWAWWALKAGNVRNARKHAFVGLRLAPLSMESWRAMACAIRGY